MPLPARIVLLLFLSALVGPVSAQHASQDRTPTGFTFAGLPALNYNSDEGIGYGARLSLFNHAEGGYTPYVYTLEADVFFTTGGRRQAFVFFDAPHLLGPAHRITGEVKYQRFDPAPYYGLGNTSSYEEALIDDQHPAFIHENYYGFERTRVTAWATYQRRLGAFSVLGGVGLAHSAIALLDGRTLLQEDEALVGLDGGFTNYVKAGLIYDTRDFEPAPSRGLWTDVLFEHANTLWGSDYGYTRLTFTHRHYLTLRPRLVFAQRFVFEKGWGSMPFYEMAFYGGSFKIEEGLGGSKSVRGHLRNRFLGPTKLFGTLEIRWRVWDVTLLHQDLYLALSAFLDYGRVWRDGAPFSLRTLHTGQGGGLHVGWNETFIVTANIARSAEVHRALYLTIGYLF